MLVASLVRKTLAEPSLGCRRGLALLQRSAGTLRHDRTESRPACERNIAIPPWYAVNYFFRVSLPALADSPRWFDR